MTKYSKIRLQVSVLRTNGPLVDFVGRAEMYVFKTCVLSYLGE